MDLELIALLEEKLQLGNSLIQKLGDRNEDGVRKLRNEIKKEVEFLDKKHHDGTLKIENIKCSNLSHFAALTTVALSVKNLVAVNRSILVDGKKIKIDIICNSGHLWIKVITRNPKSVLQISNGEGNFGSKSVISHAQEYIDASKLNSVFFKQPQVVFYFSNAIEGELESQLRNLDVQVVYYLNEIKLDPETESVPEKKVLNLDVTTMLAYISNLTNGHAHCQLDTKLLIEQAEWERERPLKSFLDEEFSKYDQLICCETVFKCFQDIIGTVAGEAEKTRSKLLMERVKILPDNCSSSKNIQGSMKDLQLGGKIRYRSKVMFEFGKNMLAVSITANEGFIRAARLQGFEYVVILHECRILSEKHEVNCKILDDKVV